jgi:DNA-directed RNA polymerase subunit RPC12/RpoP
VSYFDPHDVTLYCLNCGEPVTLTVKWQQPEPVAILCRKCRGRKGKRREKVLEKTEGRCAYCGRRLDIKVAPILGKIW